MEIEQIVGREGRALAPLFELGGEVPDFLGASGLAKERTDRRARLVIGRRGTRRAPEAVRPRPVGGTGTHRHIVRPQSDRTAPWAFRLDRSHARGSAAPGLSLSQTGGLPPPPPERIRAVAPITFAHRGARADLPENTIPAFRYALEHGAQGLETDAQRSADGEVVLVHDERFRTTLGGILPRRLRVAATSTQRLRHHRIPRLVDLYDEAGFDFELSIDLKAADIGTEIIEIARERGDAHRLWLCSASTRHLRALRALAPEPHLVHSQTRGRLPSGIERHAADLAAAGIDAMNMHHSEWSRGLVALFHRFDVRAFAWDVQEVRHLRSMLRVGVDAVYCDSVDRMVGTVAEWTTDEGPGTEVVDD